MSYIASDCYNCGKWIRECSGVGVHCAGSDYNNWCHCKFPKLKYGFEEYNDPNSLMSQKMNFVCSYLYSKRRSGAVLDIGCGNGNFIDWAEKVYTHVVGIEPDEELFISCSERFEGFGKVSVLPLGVEDLSLLDEKFDCITALDVIEHVDNPLSALVSIRERLNEDGIFIFTSPNWMDYFWRILGKNPQHKTIHSSYGWAKLIESAGFKVVCVDAIRKPFGHHLLGLCVVIIATLPSKSLNNG